jgi:hypothetical protein
MIRFILIAVGCLGMSACGTDLLLCEGTMQKEGSLQTEPSSLWLSIDAYNKTMTVDDFDSGPWRKKIVTVDDSEPVQWRKTTATKIFFFRTLRDDMPGVRTGELDRRTGELTVFLNRGGLVMFKGVCH